MRLKIFCFTICCGLSACSNADYRLYSELGANDRQRVDQQAETWASQTCSAKEIQACKRDYIYARDRRVALNRLYNTTWAEMNYPQRQFIQEQMWRQCGNNQQCIAANLQARDGKIMRQRQANVETAQSIQNLQNQTNLMAIQNQYNYTQQMQYYTRQMQYYAQPRFGY